MSEDTPNIMDHINPDGTFKDSFRDTFTAFVGDEHKGSKLLETMPNLPSAMKMLFDTKSAMGNAIKRPGKDATPEQRAEFRKAAFESLGVPKKAEDFEFPRVEGRAYDEEVEKEWRQFFLDKGYPKGLVKELVDNMNESQGRLLAKAEAQQKEEADKYEKQLTDQRGNIDKLWTGDKAIEMNRLAHNAAIEFSPDPDMKALLKELKVYDDPTSHEKWEKAGLFPNQRIFLANVGLKMKSPPPPSDEGRGSKDKPEGAFGLLTHPDSIAAVEAQKRRK